jgi:hypothetical protein
VNQCQAGVIAALTDKQQAQVNVQNSTIVLHNATIVLNNAIGDVRLAQTNVNRISTQQLPVLQMYATEFLRLKLPEYQRGYKQPKTVQMTINEKMGDWCVPEFGEWTDFNEGLLLQELAGRQVITRPPGLDLEKVESIASFSHENQFRELWGRPRDNIFTFAREVLGIPVNLKSVVTIKESDGGITDETIGTVDDGKKKDKGISDEVVGIVDDNGNVIDAWFVTEHKKLTVTLTDNSSGHPIVHFN